VSVSGLFLEFSRWKLLDEYWPRLRSSVESLTDEQVWWRPNDASNSIGNLILHLNGNVRQWLIASFSGADDARNRPAEFAERNAISPAALLKQLGATMDEASAVLSKLTEADLLRTLNIQGYTVSGVEAVYQVIEHFGMHYGQILYITKLVRGENLGFYRELDATGRVPNFHNPDTSPAPMEWLALDEGERIALVSAYHERNNIHLPDAQLHAVVHVVVENQLAMGEATVIETLERLQKEGLGRHDAIHAIGSVLAEDLYTLMQDQTGPADATYQKYLSGLRQLTANNWHR